MKYCAFSTEGCWDNDSIGFVGFVDSDDVNAAVTAVLKDIHAERFANVNIDSIELIASDELEAVFDAYEVSFYVDPEFDAFAVVRIDGQQDVLVGLIIVH